MTFLPMVVGRDDVDRIFVVVSVALHSIHDLDVPLQAIAEDARPQSKHIVKQIGVFVGIVSFH